MSTAPTSTPGWVLQCKLGGAWHAVTHPMPFQQAWDSLSLLQKNAAQLGIEPVERRLVTTFD